MTDLKACPFCEATNSDVGFIGHTDECYLMLRYIGAATKKQLAQAWNTRPIEDALRAELAALKELTRWIPVGERLPEKHNYVQTVTEDYEYGANMILFNGEWSCETPKPLFWREDDRPELPEPPEVE